MMKLSYLASAALLLASTAANAIVWHPTNEDTDFIQLDFTGNPDTGLGISTAGGTLSLFDDDDAGYSTPLVIGSSGGHVVFTDNMDGSWNAEVFDVTNTSGGSITLSNSANFILAIDWGAGYFGDDGTHSLLSSPDTYLIHFDGEDANGLGKSGNTLGVDLAPIPVPAAVWLFGSGLLGLVAVSRRRA